MKPRPEGDTQVSKLQPSNSIGCDSRVKLLYLCNDWHSSARFIREMFNDKAFIDINFIDEKRMMAATLANDTRSRQLENSRDLSDIWGVSKQPPAVSTVVRVAHCELFRLKTILFIWVQRIMESHDFHSSSLDEYSSEGSSGEHTHGNFESAIATHHCLYLSAQSPQSNNLCFMRGLPSAACHMPGSQVT